MPYHAYVCSDHGEFTIRISFEDEIPEWSLCPFMEEHDHEQCREAPCEHACVRSCPRGVDLPVPIKVKRSWEEQANAARSTRRNMVQEQMKHDRAGREAKEKYGDERCAFDD